jgi:hypothetical protein
MGLDRRRLCSIAIVVRLSSHDLLGEMDQQAFGAMVAKLREGAQQPKLEQ